jgi:hypothetical protein
MQVSTSERQREAAKEAIALLRNQAAGLAATGSVNTVGEINRAVDALSKLAASESADLSLEEKALVERATFLLQGTRVGLESADFHDRAKKVQETIDDLADVVGDYNAQLTDNLEE